MVESAIRGLVMPPGSMLAPLLFILYMNDLSENVSSDGICLYIEDTGFVVRGNKVEDLNAGTVGDLRDLPEAVEWFDSNNLPLNKRGPRQYSCRPSIEMILSAYIA